MKNLQLFIAFFSITVSLTHTFSHSPSCCHASLPASEVLATCFKEFLKKLTDPAECDHNDEMVILGNNTEKCLCENFNKECHFKNKCTSEVNQSNSIRKASLQAVLYLCVPKEFLITLNKLPVERIDHACDQLLNSLADISEDTMKRPKHKTSTFPQGKKNNIEAASLNSFKKTKYNFLETSKNNFHHFSKKIQNHKTSTLHGKTTSFHHKNNLIQKPITTRKHYSRYTLKPSKLHATIEHHAKASKTELLKQHVTKSRPEMKMFYEWMLKHTKPHRKSPSIILTENLNKMMFAKKDADGKIKKTKIDSLNPEFEFLYNNFMSDPKNFKKRQAEEFSYQDANRNNFKEVKSDDNNNDSAAYNTFLNRGVLLWFNSLAEPRWIKSHINENAEKFSLYVVLFVFFGIISTMGAVIYRLFFQVKRHKNYIIGKRNDEKENFDTNDGNANENDDKEKDTLKKEGMEGEEKFNSPGNWRTPESESSTGDDRTIRDDDHANVSNIERTDSRHVMCTIVSQERSLDEISQVEQRQQDPNNNNQQPNEQRLSGQMVSSLMQQTSSPPLSAITNRSSPSQSPHIHQTQHQQPGLPSPPGSFMFDPPPMNDMNPMIVDHSMVQVHPPKMSDHDPENPDVNTLARRSRELY